MKTLPIARILIAVLASFFYLPQANAVTPRHKVKTAPVAFQTAVYPSHSDPVVHVIVQKEEGGTVQVVLKTQKGERLAEQTLSRKKEKVAMRFRLNELPDGAYVVEVSNGREVTTKTFQLSTQPQEAPRTLALY